MNESGLRGIIKISAILICGSLMTACRTYYDKTLTFNKKFEEGNYSAARDYLASQDKMKRSHVKVLYDLNYATASFMMDSTESSISHFDAADKYYEDFSKNFSYEALALITNPSVKPYELEYYEAVMIHFYQALNYIKLGETEDAIVECKRMNLVLENLSDAFRKHDGKRYSRDAFGHLVMGILYEMAGNNNNAFIAYRNSLEIYADDYTKLFSCEVPDLLKRGIIRTAYRTGFAGEGRRYEKQFGMTYEGNDANKGRLVVFLLDGMSPIKTQSTVDFLKGNGSGFVNFSNSQTGITIPLYWGDCSESDKNSLRSISYVRLAIPQYESRGSQCCGRLKINGAQYSPELVEDVDKVARQSLKDRLWKELGKAILRAATKEALHQVVAKRNDYAGLFLAVSNAVTEKADTRSWMSLPSCVRLTDVELDAGSYELDYTSCVSESATIQIEAGKTSFVVFRGF